MQKSFFMQSLHLHEKLAYAKNGVIGYLEGGQIVPHGLMDGGSL